MGNSTGKCNGSPPPKDDTSQKQNNYSGLLELEMDRITKDYLKLVTHPFSSLKINGPQRVVSCHSPSI